MHCRVVSWNVHSFVGSDGRYDVDRVAAVLQSLHADIVGLQEVDWRHAGQDGPDPFDRLANVLGMHAVEGPNLHDHRGRYGNGLLTRLQIADATTFSLAYGGREPRGAIDARLEHGDRTIRVLVTHLGLKLRERRNQVRRIRDALESGPSADATILLGDMNEWITARLMRRAFTPKPFHTLITGRTFPSQWPVFPLDCIFVTPQPDHREHRILDSPEIRAASDHLPILADLEWTP